MCRVRRAVLVSLLSVCSATAGAQERGADLTEPTPGGAGRDADDGRLAARGPSPVARGGASACWDPRDYGAADIPHDDADRCRRGVVEMVELYVWAGLLGIGTGALLVDALDVEDPGLTFGLSALGAAGTSLAVYSVDDWQGGLLPGAPSAVSTGIVLGAFEGFLAWTAFGNEIFTGPGVGAFYWGSATLGALVGGAVAVTLEPTTGDSSFVRSGAIWGTFLSAMANLAFGIGEDRVDTFSVLFTGYNAGIVGAAILGSVLRPSRLAALTMDLGALGGALVGTLLAGPERVSEQAVGAVVGLTTVAGMALSLWLTTPSDPRESHGETVAARVEPWGGPVEGGAVVGTTTRF